MAGRAGLEKKIIEVKGKKGRLHKRTYWVKPAESQTARLAKVRNELKESRALTERQRAQQEEREEARQGPRTPAASPQTPRPQFTPADIAAARARNEARMAGVPYTPPASVSQPSARPQTPRPSQADLDVVRRAIEDANMARYPMPGDAAPRSPVAPPPAARVNLSVTLPAGMREASPAELHAAVLKPPVDRREGALDPTATPVPKLNIPDLQIDLSMVPMQRGRLPDGTLGRVPQRGQPTSAVTMAFYAANAPKFITAGKAIEQMVSGADAQGCNTLRVQTATQMYHLTRNRAVCGGFAPDSHLMLLREDMAKKILIPIMNRDVGNAAEMSALGVWTHETFHAASHLREPQVEYKSALSQPNRWLEEGTTELLSQHYVHETSRAFTGSKTIRPSSVLHPSPTGNSLQPEVTAYTYQCQRFAHVAGYLSGVKSTDSEGDINRVVMHHALEVKKRGDDRYQYLAEQTLKAHGIKKEHDPELYALGVVEVMKGYRGFLGAAAPSTMKAVPGDLSTASVEAVVNTALKRALVIRQASNSPVTYPVPAPKTAPAPVVAAPRPAPVPAPTPPTRPAIWPPVAAAAPRPAPVPAAAKPIAAAAKPAHQAPAPKHLLPPSPVVKPTPSALTPPASMTPAPMVTPLAPATAVPPVPAVPAAPSHAPAARKGRRSTLRVRL